MYVEKDEAGNIIQEFHTIPNGYRNTSGDLSTWTEAERNAIGLFQVEDPELSAANKAQKALQFGQGLIQQIAQTTAQSGMSAQQQFEFAQALLAPLMMLYFGNLPAALAGFQSATVDGEVITQQMIDFIVGQIQSFQP